MAMTGVPVTRAVPLDIRRQYRWLYLPLLAWVILVFPLVLPPIPIGPLAFSLAWNRREYMSHINRAMAHLGRQRKKAGFPMGWLVNVFVNLFDMVTLGLSTLFVTAELVSAMIKQDGSPEERAEIDPVAWAFKWLFLGNVVFLALYIACPGLIYERLLTRLERHLYTQYKPVQGVVKSPVAADAGVAYQGVTTYAEVLAQSQSTPVLLYAEDVPTEAEPQVLPIFEKALENLASVLLAQKVAVRWCNLNQSRPSHYREIAQQLATQKPAQRGWYLFRGGVLANHRAVNALPGTAATSEQLASLGRQVLGVPQAAILSQDRLSTDGRLTSLEQAKSWSSKAPMVVIVPSSIMDEDATTLDIRKKLWPQIAPTLRAAGAGLCLAFPGAKDGARLKEDIQAVQNKFTGALLYRNGQLASQAKLGYWSTSWDDYAKAIKGWFDNPQVAPGASVEATYYIARSLAEVQTLGQRQPVLAITTQQSDEAAGQQQFADEVLPDIWHYCQRVGVQVCWCNAQPTTTGLPSSAALLVRGGQVVQTREVQAGAGSSTRYVTAARALLGS